MPQDIPLEASETLTFTPPALSNLDSPPSFVLRAATTREKRHLRRLHLEQNIRSHNQAALRDEILRGLKKLWSPEVFEKHSETLTAYWSALDDYTQQSILHAKEQEGLSEDERAEFPEFDYDPEIREACEDLSRRVVDSWPKLRTMVADNVEFAELTPAAMAAVVVKSFKGLSVPASRDRGYLTFECTQAIEEALSALEEENDLPAGEAWGQLFLACSQRMFLDEAERKNSASPSPSGMSQPASSPTGTTAVDGPSPASATSTETPDIS